MQHAQKSRNRAVITCMATDPAKAGYKLVLICNVSFFFLKEAGLQFKQIQPVAR